MNQRLISVARRSISVALLLLGSLAVVLPIAWGQPPVVIPPGAATPTAAPGQADSGPAGPYYHVTGIDDHLKMVVNSSRFLVLNKKIPQVQVNNPDVLDVMPMSPNQVQISAKRTGVTQVNLWGEDKRIYTVNVVVTGDAAELTQTLRELFPRASLTVVPVNGNSVVISGYVDQQDAVPKIVSVAGKYFPDVINNMTVSGVQQGMLHVKVFEISRTKLRNMGFDFANVSGSGTLFWSGVNGLLSSASGAPFGGPAAGSAPDNVFKFSTGGANAFYGVLNALREDDLAKLDAEPDLVAISGRPAYMLVGGEIGYQVTNALSGTMVGFKEYGTRLDFVPIVLGNGRMHIDLRARVSALDAANSAGGIPALTTRETETGVELRAGQTLAIAGLIQRTTEAENHGLPWISEIPYVGVPFRSVSHSTNEIELLVLVTPEIVDGMNPGQVPTCLPGMQTSDPSDWELFFKGHLEVPNCCPDGSPACQSCPVVGASAGFSPGEGPLSRQNPQNPSAGNQIAMNPQPAEPGFIGPIGYDVLK
jgi:pilus assembly protein CpaC